MNENKRANLNSKLHSGSRLDWTRVPPHEHDFDYSVNPAGTCTICGYND